MYMALFYVVEPGYLDAMGLKLKSGRFFTNQDTEKSPRVVVIDDMLARERFGSENPLGRRLNLDDDQGPYEIIGVVGHVKQWVSIQIRRRVFRRNFYLPFRALPDREIEGRWRKRGCSADESAGSGTAFLDRCAT
jgi:putative ABC transport system permease protein